MSRLQRGWLVVARMQQEIARQQDCGKGCSCTIFDNEGRISIHGVLDLPALAVAVEKAIIEARFPVEHEQ